MGSGEEVPLGDPGSELALIGTEGEESDNARKIHRMKKKK